MKLTRYNTQLFEDIEELLKFLNDLDIGLKELKAFYFYEHQITSSSAGWLLTVEIIDKLSLKAKNVYGEDL
jgi:hypothetical protein